MSATSIIFVMIYVLSTTNARHIEAISRKIRSLEPNFPAVYKQKHPDELQRVIDDFILNWRENHINILEESRSGAAIGANITASYVDDPCDDGDESRNCCTQTKVEQLFHIDSEEKKKIVIQSKYFQQIIKSTRCKLDDHTCFSDMELESKGYKTACVTDFTTMKLFVFNEDTHSLEVIDAEYPVSCSCRIYIQD